MPVRQHRSRHRLPSPADPGLGHVERFERAATPNFEVGRRGCAPRAVVVHTTDGTFAGTLAWFAVAGERGQRPLPRRAATGDVVRAGRRGRHRVPRRAGTAPRASPCSVTSHPTSSPSASSSTTTVVRTTSSDPTPSTGPGRCSSPASPIGGASRSTTTTCSPHRLINPRRPARATSTSTAARPGRVAAADARGRAERRRPEPRLVVLLPARNAAADLPDWFASVERFADAVVALDDGSTDDTAAILDAHPLVRSAPAQPPPRHLRRLGRQHQPQPPPRRRPATLGPDWILSLDADERIAADDADALRALPRPPTRSPASPTACSATGCGVTAATPTFGWVYRLFAAAPGQQLAGRAAALRSGAHHASAANRHVRTSLRIQHWGSSDEARAPGAHRQVPAGRPRRPVPDRPRRRSTTCPSAVEPWPTAAGGSAGAARTAPRRVDARHRSERTPRLVVLLPARNAAADLPDWFASVERFADAVVALDDGSTDDTAAILDAHPLVADPPAQPPPRHLRRLGRQHQSQPPPRRRPATSDARLDPLPRRRRTHPRRRRRRPAPLPRHRRAPRPRLRHAVLPHDRRRSTTTTATRCGCTGCSPPRPASGSPTRVCTSCPSRPRSRATGGCAPRSASSTSPASPTDRREARRDKYREADPDIEFQAGYDHLLEHPTEVLRLRAAPARAAGAAGRATRDRRARRASTPTRRCCRPSSSAATTRTRIERAVRSVVDQECDEPVRGDRRDQRRRIAPPPSSAARFPEVRVVELDHAALPGEARNAGLRRRARRLRVVPRLARRAAARQPGRAHPPPTTRDGRWSPAPPATAPTRRPAGPPTSSTTRRCCPVGRPSELTDAPAHCSYERRRAARVGGFPDDVRAGEDTVGQRRAVPRRPHRVPGGRRAARPPQPVHHAVAPRPSPLRARARAHSVPAFARGRRRRRRPGPPILARLPEAPAGSARRQRRSLGRRSAPRSTAAGDRWSCSGSARRARARGGNTSDASRRSPAVEVPVAARCGRGHGAPAFAAGEATACTS